MDWTYTIDCGLLLDGGEMDGGSVTKCYRITAPDTGCSPDGPPRFSSYDEFGDADLLVVSRPGIRQQ